MGCSCIYLIVSVYVGLRARQIGYSSLAWFLVAVSVSPIIAAGLLSLLPNRRWAEAKSEEEALVASQLATSVKTSWQIEAIPAGTIGDDTTLE